MTENSIDELSKWIISVNRRLILFEYLKKHTIAKASDIAHERDRSIQNISRALKEFENRGLIECLTPDKTTWKSIYLRIRAGRSLKE
ncbi:sugar-specific transcriptional regulator TrmB [Methanolobus halotolerans]|uniref:sugar-specific transcriptional regulator TrmB n=1 Tax=Methanolobus halotolerans TaxID=2052935 RepID=UPI001F282741|nr:sugar-specific transcriptional regulator TrmB [Methanolobus halotolerans]